MRRIGTSRQADRTQRFRRSRAGGAVPRRIAATTALLAAPMGASSAHAAQFVYVGDASFTTPGVSQFNAPFGLSASRFVAALVGVLVVVAGAAVLLPGSGGVAVSSWQSVTAPAGLSVPRLGPAGSGAGAPASLGAWRGLPGPAQSAVSAALGRESAAYHATPVAGGLALRSSAGGVNARFDRSGVHLHAGGADVGLALRSVGYGSALDGLPVVAPRAHANRVEFAHPGISEWFVNGPAGLEHGVTLAHRPAGVRQGRLTLGLALAGTTTAVVDGDGRGATLRDGAGSLRYAGLWAVDARERRLPARLSVVGGQLRVAVDDRRARYPVTIDPFVQTAELDAGDDSASLHGWSVAMSGDTIVVGGPLPVPGTDNEGTIDVFVRPAGGWANASTRTARLAGFIDSFAGSSVAISGDTIVAGARTLDDEGGTDVYVYVRPAGGWVDTPTPTATLTSDDGFVGLGYSVAIAGDTIVAGAPATVPPQSETFQPVGAAFVYVRPATGWHDATQTAKLTASDGADNDLLGVSVGITGETIVAGA
ncbi:MAG: hypothetical protein QOJ89_2454, partial [bacterium]